MAHASSTTVLERSSVTGRGDSTIAKTHIELSCDATAAYGVDSFALRYPWLFTFNSPRRGILLPPKPMLNPERGALVFTPSVKTGKCVSRWGGTMMGYRSIFLGFLGCVCCVPRGNKKREGILPSFKRRAFTGF